MHLIKPFFFMFSGLTSQEECENCTPGFYCDEAGLQNVSGQCREGYYCPGSSQSEEDFPCPVGSFCPVGSASPILCKAGTFQPNLQRSKPEDCLNCTEGLFQYLCV